MSYETIYKYDQRTVNARDAAKALNAYCDGLVPQGMNVQDIQQYRLENNDDLLLLYYVAEYYNTASGNPASFPDGADDVPVKALAVAIDTIQQGSGTPDVENPRLFTPTTSATIMQMGKNMYGDGDVEVASTNGYTAYIPLSQPLPPGTYTISAKAHSEATTNARIRFYERADNNGYLNALAVFGNDITQRSSVTFTISKTAKYIRAYSANDIASGTGKSASILDIQIETGSNETEYEDYKERVPLTIPFGAEIGDVYGGTLNVTTGELRVTHRFIEFDGTENWLRAYANEGDNKSAFYYILDDTGNAINSSGVFSVLPAVSSVSATSPEKGARVYVYNNRPRAICRFINLPDTVEDFKTYLAELKTAGTPLQVVYELATPQVYRISGNEIKTLLGDNSILCDTGDVSVTYRAVPSLG